MADDDDDFRQQPHQRDEYDVHRQIQAEERLGEPDTPFSNPGDAEDEFPDQHQLHDYERDSQEAYDEGEDDAAVDSLGSNLNSNNPAILGYDPDKDKRRKK